MREVTGDEQLVDQVRVWAYLDDIFFFVPPHLMGQAADLVAQRLAQTGYEINIDKIEFWAPHGIPAQLAAEPRIAARWREHGLLVLGSPLTEDIDVDTNGPLPVAIGSEAFRQAVADAVLQKTRLAVELLVALPALATPTAPAVQVAQLLLRLCILPRIVHLLRSSFTDVILNLASDFDVLVHEAFERLVECSFDADSLAGKQLRLPLWAGGAGYTPMRLIAPAAYLGSWMTCLGHVEAVVGGGHLLGEGALAAIANESSR